jgi:hypothetical protein
MEGGENEMLETWYTQDQLRASDGKFDALRLAFAPLAFQAARCLWKMGFLKLIDAAGPEGISLEELERNLKVSRYTASVLLEMGLSMNLVKLTSKADSRRFVLGKTGWFFLHDPMVKVNMNFVHDVCYAGGFFLQEALTTNSPEGLKVFGSWKTIYQALSSLPEDVRKSWFAFDHYYSDAAFPEALDIVFQEKRRLIMDIGGNTAKWAMLCVDRDPDVRVVIVDLPGQADMARENIAQAKAASRLSVHEADVLKPGSTLPHGADVVWMSQFLDCFSLNEVTSIARKVEAAVDSHCDIFVMEPLWDKQRYPAEVYSLHATSLYFAAMANGNSKMYGSRELIKAISAGGLSLKEATHRVGPNDYSLLRFRKG